MLRDRLGRPLGAAKVLRLVAILLIVRDGFVLIVIFGLMVVGVEDPVWVGRRVPSSKTLRW